MKKVQWRPENQLTIFDDEINKARAENFRTWLKHVKPYKSKKNDKEAKRLRTPKTSL